MSLRIHKASTLEGVAPAAGGDDWGTRIAKLVPAEALGLYGAAIALVPADTPARLGALWVIVAVCCLLTVIIRYRSTLDPMSGKPQTTAIAIALISFLIWLTALGAPSSPIALPASVTFAGPLAALLWGTIVPYLYKGDS